MNKKGVELSINVIIITIISLLVLVIVIYIFTGRTQLFSKGAEACSTKQGVCIPTGEACPGPVIAAKDCSDMDPVHKCCVRVS